MFTLFWWENLMESNHLKHPGVDRIIISNEPLKNLCEELGLD
jgi:hypothetical protein